MVYWYQKNNPSVPGLKTAVWVFAQDQCHASIVFPLFFFWSLGSLGLELCEICSSDFFYENTLKDSHVCLNNHKYFFPFWKRHYLKKFFLFKRVLVFWSNAALICLWKELLTILFFSVRRNFRIFSFEKNSKNSLIGMCSRIWTNGA